MSLGCSETLPAAVAGSSVGLEGGGGSGIDPSGASFNSGATSPSNTTAGSLVRGVESDTNSVTSTGSLAGFPFKRAVSVPLEVSIANSNCESCAVSFFGEA
ncbi:hypothetical protein CFP56_041538 [Quercus suber]|uniref:Uncharacterized protein n=1 Tax=Quercus suber TaxID=58331 RepID=A0AAW0IUH7_QUESU